MTLESEVRTFVQRFAQLMRDRDVDRHADLYLRDPAPMVVFSDGERAVDWLDVYVRLKRDLARVHLERVEAHDVVARDLGGVVAVTFLYDLHVRDMWGMPSVVTRHASLTLVESKDGFRIAAAHYSA